MEDRTRAILVMAEELSGAEFKRGAKPEEIPKFLDCSSFVQYVFTRVFGVDIPRRAYQQAGLGTVVRNEQDLVPGDLLFFEGHIAGRRPVIVEGKEYWVGHVAIYVGNGVITHCTRKDGVRVRALAEARDKLLVLMKRIPPCEITPST